MTIRDHRPTNTQPPERLSAENRALLEREEGACLFAQGFDQQGARFYPENLNHLLNAARAEGPTSKPRAGSERERVARIVELAIMRHGVSEYDLRNTLDDADAILSTREEGQDKALREVVERVRAWASDLDGRVEHVRGLTTDKVADGVKQSAADLRYLLDRAGVKS